MYKVPAIDVVPGFLMIVHLHKKGTAVNLGRPLSLSPIPRIDSGYFPGLVFKYSSCRLIIAAIVVSRS